MKERDERENERETAAECLRWRKILELIFRWCVLDRPLITRMATRCENPAHPLSFHFTESPSNGPHLLE